MSNSTKFPDRPAEEHPYFAEVENAVEYLNETLLHADAPHRFQNRGSSPTQGLQNFSDELSVFWGQAKQLGGVFGVGIGVAGSIARPEPRLTIFVRNVKRFCRIFRDSLKIPFTSGGTLHTIQVTQSGPFKSAGQGYSRPVHCGCSVGHSSQPGGSVGCVVRRIGDNERVYLLSAAHVLAGSNHSRPGEPVYQPAVRFGQGHPNHQLGRLVDYTRLVNGARGDVAIAEPDLAGVLSPAIWPTTMTPAGGRMPRLLDEVTMYYGAGSNNPAPVKGIVRSIKTTVQMRFNGFNWVILSSMALASLNIQAGDSGTGLFDDQKHIVGILSGQNDRGLAVFTPFPTAEAALNIQL